MRTSTGLPFDEKAVRWLRWRYRILTAPSQLLHDGELTVAQVAERLSVSSGVIYAWITTGKLAARRGPANRALHPVRRQRRAGLPPAGRELVPRARMRLEHTHRSGLELRSRVTYKSAGTSRFVLLKNLA
ncbi:MAG: helix-turn-helix domain-containing protein [Solirubrobacteraceae bacterium]